MFKPLKFRFIVKRRKLARRGTSAVEFALVAPIFFLFLMGTIEFGRVMMVQNVLINAAREGCRAAIIQGATASSVQTKATNYATTAGVSSTPAWWACQRSKRSRPFLR